MAMKTRRLKCLHEYRNGPRDLHYLPGTEFEAPEDLAEFLLQDAPVCFEEVTAKAVKRPPRNKAMKAPPKDK